MSHHVVGLPRPNVNKGHQGLRHDDRNLLVVCPGWLRCFVNGGHRCHQGHHYDHNLHEILRRS